MNASATPERRRFHRVLFDAPARLIQAGQSRPVQLLDISLNGALSRLPDDCKLRLGDNVELHIPLEDSGLHIEMSAEVAHIEGDEIGYRRTHIDMDSISHLRRLVELNLGDEELLHRDLEALG